jgi:hypothetical protein
LWACPTAKQPTECCCEKDDKENESYHGYPEDEEILGPENLAKNDEFGIRDIEHKQRPPIDFNKGQPKK